MPFKPNPVIKIGYIWFKIQSAWKGMKLPRDFIISNHKTNGRLHPSEKPQLMHAYEVNIKRIGARNDK